MKALYLVPAACFFLGLLSAPETAAQQRPAWHRWAVIASQDLQADGLPDLLTAELSRMGGLELVERERLDLAAKELEVAACFDSAAAGKRLQLGRWLGADGLLLLSLEQREQKKYVKVVISDCVYGARLRVEYLPYANEDLPPVAKRAGGVLQAARQQFADGIRGIIAVSPFISQDLTHDFDHWQNGFAALVEQALMTVPGVAVLELEEARAIGQELAVTGGDVRERLVPVFVDGEYATSRATPEAEPTMRLTIRVTQGDRRLETVSPGPVTEAEVVSVLAERLPRKLVRMAESGDGVPLDRSRQFALLAQRAEAFSELGQWPQSTSLREAALLLQPQSVEQRLRLIREYQRWAGHYFLSAEKTAPRGGDSGADSSSPAKPEQPPLDRVLLFRHVARNIETVVASGRLHPYDAACLLNLISARGWIRVTQWMDTPPELAVEQRRLFWNVAPRLPALDASAPLLVANAVGHCSQCAAWTDSLRVRLLYHIPQRQQKVLGPHGERHTKSVWDDRFTLEDWYRLLTEVFPQDSPASDMTSQMAGAGASSLVGIVRDGRVTAEEANRFLERLKSTNQRVSQFYGRCGALALKAYRPEMPSLSETDSREADELIAYFVRERLPQGCDVVRQSAERTLRGLRDEVRRKAGLAVMPNPLPVGSPIPPPEPDRPLAFRPVPGLTGSWTRLRPCGSEFDLMWASNVVYTMRERGVVAPIFSSTSRTDMIADVCWDGENIWVVSIPTGVRVLSPQGEVLGELQFGRELPPRTTARTGIGDPPIWLHPLSPGRCLILGRMGPELRSWIVVARKTPAADGSRPPAIVATVIHTATKTSTAPEDSLDEAFVTRWLTEYADPRHPDQRLLLIGRQERLSDRISGRRPLALDLETFQISVFPTFLPACAVDHQEVHAADGRIVWTSRYGTDIFSPDAGDPQRPHWDRKPLVLPDFKRGDVPRCHLLPLGGQVYRPGYYWYRIDTSQGRAERLHRERLPNRHMYHCQGISVHYGLVAWNIGDRVHQVLLGGPATPDQDLHNEFFYVPDSDRAKHVDAVRALREAGVRVDASYEAATAGVLHAPETSYRLGDASVVDWTAPAVLKPKRGWSTIACVSADWRGDAAALDSLQDLWGLRDLWLVGVNVDNRSLARLRGLRDLQSLALIDIPVDNDGLAVLAQLTSLSYLRLEESSDAGRLGDEGLRHLTLLPELRELKINGHGFTDGAVPYLKAMPKLYRVFDQGNSLTDQAIEELRRQNIGVMRNLW